MGVYRFGAWSVFADLRRELGVPGDLGAGRRVSITPSSRHGRSPRSALVRNLNYANASYLQTYLGVTAAESITSGLRAYEPGGGIRS